MASLKAVVISTDKNRTLNLISSYQFHVTASNVSIIYIHGKMLKSKFKNIQFFYYMRKITQILDSLFVNAVFDIPSCVECFFLNLQLLPGSNSIKCLVPTTNNSTLAFHFHGFLKSHSNFSHFMGTN